MSVAAQIAYLTALLFQGRRRLQLLTVQASTARLPHDQRASAQNLASAEQWQAQRQAERERLAQQRGA